MLSIVQSLAHHNSKHTGDFQFHCKTCAKGFNNFKLLEEHEHIHTGAYGTQPLHDSGDFDTRYVKVGTGIDGDKATIFWKDLTRVISILY
jgi:hypothetical protein